MFQNTYGNENLIHKCPEKNKQKVVTGGFLLQSLSEFVLVEYFSLIQDFF